MQKWLEQNLAYKKQMLAEFIEETQKALTKIAEDDGMHLGFIIKFDKDAWLNGDVEVNVFNFGNKKKVFPNYQSALNNNGLKYIHNVSNKARDIMKSADVSKLMQHGVLTNNWFYLLDTLFVYNVDLFLSEDLFLVDDNAATFRERKYHETHKGFNLNKK